jgi:hypothetical protein
VFGCVCVCARAPQQRQIVPCTELPSWFFITKMVSACSAVRCESLNIVQGNFSLQRVMYGVIYRLECSRMRVGISTYLDVYCFDNCVRCSFGAHTASVQWVFFCQLSGEGVTLYTRVRTECNARPLEFYCGNGGGEGVLYTGDRIRYSD